MHSIFFFKTFVEGDDGKKISINSSDFNPDFFLFAKNLHTNALDKGKHDMSLSCNVLINQRITYLMREEYEQLHGYASLDKKDKSNEFFGLDHVLKSAKCNIPLLKKHSRGAIDIYIKSKFFDRFKGRPFDPGIKIADIKVRPVVSYFKHRYKNVYNIISRIVLDLLPRRGCFGNINNFVSLLDCTNKMLDAHEEVSNDLWSSRLFAGDLEAFFTRCNTIEGLDFICDGSYHIYNFNVNFNNILFSFSLLVTVCDS